MSHPAKKLLVLTSRFPYPLEKGDKLRLYRQIQYLSRRFNIVLVSLTERGLQDDHLEALRPLCTNIHCIEISRSGYLLNAIKGIWRGWPLQIAYFYSAKAAKEVHRILKQEAPDYIYCQLIRMAPYLPETDRLMAIDYMDAFSMRAARRAELSGWMGWFWKYQARLLRAFEANVGGKFPIKYVIAESDQLHLEKAGVESLQILSNGVDAEYFRPHPETKKDVDVAFVGNMSYYPNAQAAQYLVNEIVPILRSFRKNLKVLIAGASPTRKVRKLSERDVIVTGHLEDIRDAYARSKVVVAPIFAGSGQQNKILEAMAMEVPCITTVPVGKAIGVSSDLVPVAESAAEFARLANQFLDNPELRNKVGDLSRKFVLQHFNWDACCRPLLLITKEETVLENG